MSCDTTDLMWGSRVSRCHDVGLSFRTAYSPVTARLSHVRAPLTLVAPSAGFALDVRTAAAAGSSAPLLSGRRPPSRRRGRVGAAPLYLLLPVSGGRGRPDLTPGHSAGRTVTVWAGRTADHVI